MTRPSRATRHRCKGAALGAAVALLGGAAGAAPAPPDPRAAAPDGSVAYDATRLDPSPNPANAVAVAKPPSPPGLDLDPSLKIALDAAAAGDISKALAAKAGLADPLARKLVDFALLDEDGPSLELAGALAAAASLDGWPRSARRRAAIEKMMDAQGPSPTQVISFFAGSEPTTPQGAMALASALQAQGRAADAASLIRGFWRSHIFEADQQARMRARFGDLITPEDDKARLNTLLYGAQGPAARAMLAWVPDALKALAEARMAFRADRSDASTLYEALPLALQSDPGLAFDRARYLRRRNLEVIALGLTPYLNDDVPANPETQTFVWDERRGLMNAALRVGDGKTAYAIAALGGLTAPQEKAEAAFFAGWLALSRLKDPALADARFAEMQAIVTSPISVAKAAYWRGRAAEARGDSRGAAEAYGRAARHYTTFYGQLAAEKLGRTAFIVGGDPVITPAARAAFDGLELVRAARLLHAAGAKDLERAFVLASAETFASETDLAQLVDMTRSWGEQDLSMRVVRLAAQRGVILPERGYPILPIAETLGSAEPAFMLSIARQESNFDPMARSGPGALGLMQLMPTTAKLVARQLGLDYSPARLHEVSYNMRLGGRYLGHLIDVFGGSVVLASAGYNAGPGRPSQWISWCGDPRAATTDPVDFIECIPFSQTRNYVMRTLETTQIYRARLAGGASRLTLAEDLRRGAPPPTGLIAPGPPGAAKDPVADGETVSPR